MTHTIRSKIDVGGYRLYVECQGVGRPTVVFDTGLADPSPVWRDLPRQVATFARTCVYDRAGLGQSDPLPGPRSAGQAAADLWTLLQAAAIPGPYLLVAHSASGFTARLFATRHRAATAGLVLLDSSHEDQAIRLPAAMTPDEAEGYRRMRAGLPPELDLDASADEVRALGPSTAKPLGNLPLAVLTAPLAVPPTPSGPRLAQVWIDMQIDLARLSANSIHYLAERSGHCIHHDRPDLVLTAIEEVIRRYEASLC